MATDMNNSQNPSALPLETQPPKKQKMVIKVPPPISLPQTLIAYCDPGEPSSKFYLEDSSNRKMFAVTTHGGLTGDRKSIRVHSGPATDDPLLSEVIPKHELSSCRVPETENIPAYRNPNLPGGWMRTLKVEVSERCYPYEYKLYPGPTSESVGPEEESPLYSDHKAADEGAEPIAMVSWKRPGHKRELFKFQFLLSERGSYMEDKWRPRALMSGLSLWSRKCGSLPHEAASLSHAPRPARRSPTDQDS